MANATSSTGNAMVVDEGVEKSYWRSPTGYVPLVTIYRFILHDQRVKNSPRYNHGDQQAELTVDIAKVQLH